MSKLTLPIELAHLTPFAILSGKQVIPVLETDGTLKHVGLPQYAAYLASLRSVSFVGQGPNLTMAGAVYDTATPLFGSGSLSAGTGTAALTLAPPGEQSLECFFRSSVAPGSNTPIVFYTGVNEGIVIVNSGNVGLLMASGSVIDSGINVCDGGTHYLVAMLRTGGNYSVSIGVDSQLQVFSGTQPSVGANPTVQVGGFGTIDEVRISNTSRQAGVQAVRPTAPFAWDSNTVGLWHLDGNGNSE